MNGVESQELLRHRLADDFEQSVVPTRALSYSTELHE